MVCERTGDNSMCRLVCRKDTQCWQTVSQNDAFLNLRKKEKEMKEGIEEEKEKVQTDRQAQFFVSVWALVMRPGKSGGGATAGWSHRPHQCPFPLSLLPTHIVWFMPRQMATWELAPIRCPAMLADCHHRRTFPLGSLLLNWFDIDCQLFCKCGPSLFSSSLMPTPLQSYYYSFYY